MIKNTHELQGDHLNWAVAKALGFEFKTSSIGAVHAYRQGTLMGGFCTRVSESVRPKSMSMPDRHFSPSTNPDYGVIIIEQAGIATRKSKLSGKWWAMAMDDAGDINRMQWEEFVSADGRRIGSLPYEADKRRRCFEGESMLKAAMRCFVASVLGEEVDIPDEIEE